MHYKASFIDEYTVVITLEIRHDVTRDAGAKTDY